LKWDIEEETKELREAFEKEILKWPMRARITKLNDVEKNELKKLKEMKPFIVGQKIIKSWVHIDLEPNELNEIIPYKKSYDRTRESGKQISIKKGEVKNIWIIPLFILKFQQTILKN
jgi:hypothetical protein